MKHTPTPWTTRTEDGSIGSIDAADGTMVAQALQVRPRREDPYHEERKANAEFIVTACNAHDHLVAKVAAYETCIRRIRAIRPRDVEMRGQIVSQSRAVLINELWDEFELLGNALSAAGAK